MSEQEAQDTLQASEPAEAQPRADSFASAPAAIEAEGLERRYGRVVAVRGVNLRVPAGLVMGFIGENGAGKTTTLRMLATLERPNRGRVEICGIDANARVEEVRRKIGWMPDAHGGYERLSVAEYLDFVGRAYGFKGKDRTRRVDDVVDFTELGPLLTRDMTKLSKGQTQRLSLARALVHDPEVLLLDEPAAGLDPKARVEFKRLVRLLAEDGKTILISSHILTELAEMCDAMMFIHKGRIVRSGRAEDLLSAGKTEAGARVEVQLLGDPGALIRWAEMNPGLSLVEPLAHGAIIAPDSAEPAAQAALLARMVQDGLQVTGFSPKAQSLEEVFLDLVEAPSAPAKPAGGAGSPGAPKPGGA